MTVRKSIDEEKKKYKKKTPVKDKKKSDDSKTLMLDDEMLPQLSLMNNKYPNVTNKALIEKIMEDTFLNRRSWIQTESPSINDIISKYPRLIDYNGDMV